MREDITTLSAKFVNMHFVNKKYHQNHPQLIHRHDDCLELLYIMQGDGQYIVSGKTYLVQPGNLIICNAGIMHGEAPYLKHCSQSYCLVLQDLSLPGLPPNTLSKTSDPPVYYFTEDRFTIEHIIFALMNAPESNGIIDLLSNAMLNRKNFYLYFDSQNYNVFRGYSETCILEGLFPYMCNQLHVKDGEEMSGGLLGTGPSDFFKTMDWLDKHDYTGYILLENYYDQLPLRLQHEDPYELLRQDIATLKKAIQSK